jgi:hypothetical protein
MEAYTNHMQEKKLCDRKAAEEIPGLNSTEEVLRRKQSLHCFKCFITL